MVQQYKIVPPAIPSAGLYHFTTRHGVKYEVRFGRKQKDLLSATIVFGVLNDEYDGEEYVVTDKGDIFNVMNTITSVIDMFREEHPNVRSYEFTGEPTPGETLDKPTKRIKLYERYVRRMFDEREWDIQLDGSRISVVRKPNR